MNRIKEIRMSRGMKQAEFAEIMNAGQSTVSGWENGS